MADETTTKGDTTYSVADLRRQLLANGYSPLPNLDKRCVLEAWPSVHIDDEAIQRWSRMRRFQATGLRIENRLAAIDIDVNDEVLANRIADLILDTVPALDDPATPLLVRRGKGFKEAWFVRTAEIFSRLHTRRWVRPGDSVDDGTHSVEIFGGASPRQFGAFGAHTREDDGTVRVEYRWDDASPADTPLEKLPVLTKDQFVAISEGAERILQEAGYEPVARSMAGESEAHRVYDLTDDMVFDMANGGHLTLAQLRAEAAETEGLRCSASWLEGPSAVNTSRCLVSLTRSGHVAIWESASGVTHVEAEAAPRDFTAELNRVAEKLREIDIRTRNRISPHDGAVVTAAKLLETYAFCRNQRAPVVPLYGGDLGSGIGVTNFRLSLTKHADEEVGPRGGVKKINPVDIWLGSEKLINVEGLRMRPDKPRPTYVEGDKVWLNIYEPEVLEGGEAGDPTAGIDFIAQLVPDEAERAWFTQWLAHKYRFPAVPGPAVIMVARQFGSGRGTLATLLGRLFGQRYVKTLPFEILAGKSYQAQYTDWGAETLIAVVNESAETDGGSMWTTKKNTYEHLKALVEPRPAPRFFVRKGEASFTALSFTSYIIATNHVDALPIPVEDRRFAVLANGEPREREYWERLNAWMEDDANVAAFGEWLREIDLSDYSPFVAPPMTAAKVAMAEESTSDVERGLELALKNLAGEIFTPAQVVTLMRRAAQEDGLDYPDKWPPIAKRLLRARAYRVGVKDGQNWKPQIEGERHYVYARSSKAAARWTKAGADELRAEILKSGSTKDNASNVLNGLFKR
jgi:hypothetical protein